MIRNFLETVRSYQKVWFQLILNLKARTFGTFALLFRFKTDVESSTKTHNFVYKRYKTNNTIKVNNNLGQVKNATSNPADC